MVSIPKISALYESSLASSLSASGDSFSVVSGDDHEGNALSGLYGFVIDEGTADEEFFTGTISGTTVTITARGLDSDDPTTEVTANKKAHRRGASVKITDYPIIGFIRNILNGDLTLPNVLLYASEPTWTPGSQQLVSLKKLEDTANAGAADSGDAAKGLVETATQAEIESAAASGSTTAPLAVIPSRLGARLYYGYAADAGSNDTYAITCSPAPTAYTAGMVFQFKANTANTGVATLNVNSLGAKTIKKFKDVDLDDNDIKAGQIVTVIYDGTNLQLLSPIGKQPITQTGAEIYAADSVGSDSYAITLTPAPAALVAGMKVRFKAGTANTGAATLNVNSLGAKTIKKHHDQDLNTGDIEANQIIDVVYDSVANAWQMQSQLGTGVVSYAGAVTTHSAEATTVNRDTTFTTNFRPSVIQLYYSIQIAGATKERVGIATFSGTTLVGGMMFGGVNVDSTAVTIGNITVDGSAITASGGGSSSCTLSIQSIADDNFVVRAAIVGSAGNEVTVNYYPIAFK